MNLYLRLIWTTIRSFLIPKITYSDELIVKLRILPNDLDIDRHLNNGRYLTLLDLGSFEFFIRSGVLVSAIRCGFKPMVGGVLITYRKGLSLFEKCTLTIQLKAWDDHWSYFKFTFQKSDGQIAAAGYLKGAFVSKRGIVPNKKVDELFGYERDIYEFPQAVKDWIKSESNIL